MRLLVCGSRDWSTRSHREVMWRVLDHYRTSSLWDGLSIVEGEARGADSMAREYGLHHGIPVERFPADWSQGRGAGFARNREMLYSGVEGVAAFSVRRPATRGTAHMCRIAYEEGVPVLFVTPDGRQTFHFDERRTTR